MWLGKVPRIIPVISKHLFRFCLFINSSYSAHSNGRSFWTRAKLRSFYLKYLNGIFDHLESLCLQVFRNRGLFENAYFLHTASFQMNWHFLMFWMQNFFKSRNPNYFRCCRICFRICFNLISWRDCDGISNSSVHREYCIKTYLSFIHIKGLCYWPASRTLHWHQYRTRLSNRMTSSVDSNGCYCYLYESRAQPEGLIALVASSLSPWAWTQHLVRC